VGFPFFAHFSISPEWRGSFKAAYALLQQSRWRHSSREGLITSCPERRNHPQWSMPKPTANGSTARLPGRKHAAGLVACLSETKHSDEVDISRTPRFELSAELPYDTEDGQWICCEILDSR
jgi:hypothetical protein